MGTLRLWSPLEFTFFQIFRKPKNKTKNFNMPKGAGLTKPMKLSAELGDIVGKKEASRAECIKQLWAYIKKTSNSLSLTRKWPRFLEVTASVLLAWPNFFLPICLKSCFPLPENDGFLGGKNGKTLFGKIIRT